VFVYQDDDDRSTAITAREGTLMRASEDGSPMLRLFDGVRLNENSAQSSTRRNSASNPPVGVLRFDQLNMSLGDGRAPMFRPRGADEREFTITELWQRRYTPPPGIRSSDMIAEFNVRLARALSVPFLPLIGIPLALGRQRSDRSWGIAAGLLVLILYNQVLDVGKNMAETGEISPFLGLWLPFISFAAISLWLFWRASTRLPRASGISAASLPLLRNIGTAFARLKGRG
jgi:lipopolysaccharide export system permease protein